MVIQVQAQQEEVLGVMFQHHSVPSHLLELQLYHKQAILVLEVELKQELVDQEQVNVL